jgi:hypothetical protein
MRKLDNDIVVDCGSALSNVSDFLLSITFLNCKINNQGSRSILHLLFLFPDCHPPDVFPRDSPSPRQLPVSSGGHDRLRAALPVSDGEAAGLAIAVSNAPALTHCQRSPPPPPPPNRRFPSARLRRHQRRLHSATVSTATTASQRAALSLSLGLEITGNPTPKPKPKPRTLTLRLAGAIALVGEEEV